MEYRTAREALSPGEVEKAFGLNRDLLAHWRCKGKGPRFIKAGRRKVLYLRRDLEEWLRSNAVETR